MKLPRRQFLNLAVGTVALASMSRLAWAQSYPERPVRIVSGFPPGGINDTYARLMGHWLSERLGQQFVVENRSGAGGNIAAESVARTAPDGYTLLVATSADAWNATLYDNLKYNFVRDLAPVGTISRGPGVLVVHPTVQANSVPELIAYAKSNPGKIAVASAGVGSAPHMYWELFRGPDRGRNAARAVSRWRAGCHRSAWRPGPGVLRHKRVIDRIYHGGEAVGIGGDHRNTRSSVARCSLTRLPKRRRHPHKPTLLKREAARNLAHVVKIVSHHDTAACIFSSCGRNVSTVTVNSKAYHC
jgi:hypothetical protein